MGVETYKHKFENQRVEVLNLQDYLKLKFPDREQDEREHISNFIRELNLYSKYRTLDEIERMVQATWDAFLNLERDISMKHTAIGTIRTILDLFDDDFRRDRGYFDQHVESYAQYRALIKETPVEETSKPANLRRRRSELNPIDYSDFES